MCFSGVAPEDPCNLAETRNARRPTEEHMMIVENTLQTLVDSTPAIAADGKPKTDKSAEEPFMRHRLRDSIPFWKSIGACDMVLD